MENHMTKGRLSEKLFNAHLAGSVAIYRGHPAHSEIVNARSYIPYDENNVTGALARILELETDHDQYERTLNEPFLADGERTLCEYFSLSDRIGEGRLRWRILQVIQDMMHGT
mmetsp:Transcript_16669/g.38920  ORF Transcript_16669/g.38920 Transcript_16669/m.38920 type:complete len:113 (+) Transcript_16669:968-1306(+)